MLKYSKVIYRIIDANINRLKEGLRVCEEITRFILDSRQLTEELKRARHKIDLIIKLLPQKAVLLKERESSKDVGRQIYANELKRKNCQDVFFANIQRVKESTRVLEEFSKLIDRKISVGFKNVRYGIYELEKKIAKKITNDTTGSR